MANNSTERHTRKVRAKTTKRVEQLEARGNQKILRMIMRSKKMVLG